jgi:hypothetical protein
MPKVEQCDREAAAGSFADSQHAARIRLGDADYDYRVKAFAAHREAAIVSTFPQRARDLEDVERAAEQRGYDRCKTEIVERLKAKRGQQRNLSNTPMRGYHSMKIPHLVKHTQKAAMLRLERSAHGHEPIRLATADALVRHGLAEFVYPRGNIRLTSLGIAWNALRA